MPGNVFRQGTLLILSGPVNHLHVIMNDPVYSHEHGYEGVLAVNITSLKPDIFHDSSCVLTPGCHPFVIRDSWVVYKDAVVLNAARLDFKVDSGEVVTHQPVSNAVYQMVRDGFDKSRHVTTKILRFMKNHGI